MTAYKSVGQVESLLRADGWTVERRHVPEWSSPFVGGHVALFVTRGAECATVEQTPHGWSTFGPSLVGWSV